VLLRRRALDHRKQISRPGFVFRFQVGSTRGKIMRVFQALAAASALLCFRTGAWRNVALIWLLLMPAFAGAQATGNGGGKAPAPTICVNCTPDPPPLEQDAQFISQTVPLGMVAGQVYAVSVRMKNTGTLSWPAGNSYQLGSQNPADNAIWVVTRVALPALTGPGQIATFNFTARAPNSAGSYNFQWRMVQGPAGWFGAASTNVVVAVTGSATNSPPTVQLTSPVGGGSAGAPANVTLSANAGDTDGAVASVEFWSNGVRLLTDTTVPYSLTLSGVAAGNYLFKAVAIDNLGATATSAQASYAVTSGPAVSVTRNYVYDTNERLCKTINPESGASLVDYDAAGNILWTADGTALTSLTCDRASVTAGQKSVRTYDALNRLTGIVTPGGAADVGTTYYADGLTATLSARNPGSGYVVTSYSYNKRRLLSAESSANEATLFSLGYGYDANGFLSATSYPDGQVVTSSPDALGRATSIASASPGGQEYASNISYHPGGAISSFTYGNGLLHTMVQNARRLPARSWDRNAAGSTVVLDDNYAFDANGNVDYITDATAANANNRSRDMGYDGRDRLIVADAPYQWGAASYAYDASDNLREANQGARHYRYNYDPVSHRLSNIANDVGVNQFGFSYDTNGNVTAKGAQAYVFDIANRLNQVVGKQVYRYDGQGRRVQTTDADGKTTFWIYSQSGQVLYTSEARRGQNLSYIYLGNTQVATRAVAWGTGATTVSYQHTDSLGSPVVETSATGAIVKRNSYAPYGEAYGSNIDGTGYTGHVMDQVTGLTYMQQRYYDPAIGRSLSIDPVAARERGDNFNRYAYANNNPYKFTDPDGRESGMFQQEQYRMAQPPPDAIAGVALATLAAPALMYVGATAVAVIGDAAAGSLSGSVAVNGPAIVTSTAIVAEGATAIGGNGGAPSTLAVGPHAGASIEARSSSRTFTAAERGAINKIGGETGCHTCGATTAGTKSGNFVPDHQPVSSLNKTNAPQRLYPHCLTCSKQQGLDTIRQNRADKKLP
jgi:RHS repeat-associated protein